MMNDAQHDTQVLPLHGEGYDNAAQITFHPLTDPTRNDAHKKQEVKRLAGAWSHGMDG